MSQRFECVGGPLDGQFVEHAGASFPYRVTHHKDDTLRRETPVAVCACEASGPADGWYCLAFGVWDWVPRPAGAP